MRPILLIVLFRISTTLLTGQQIIDTSFQKSSLPTYNKYVIKDNYSNTDSSFKTMAIQQLDSDFFNRGFISDVALTMQGQMPGIQTYNRDGNPNNDALFRVRGINSFLPRSPQMIIIDGVPNQSFNNIDPNDIVSVRILKDAASQSIYGMQGTNGVVMIETKAKQFEQDTFQIRYEGQWSASSIAATTPAFTGDQFRDIGGFDLGGNTVWVDEITQSGLAQAHHLSINGRKSGVNYFLSGHYRDLTGTLKNTGYDRVNLRGQISGKLLDDKLSYQLDANINNVQRQIGIPEAFRYVNSFNPTAPSSEQALPIPYNWSQFGGYYENLGLFSSFNPLSMVDQNLREGRSRWATLALNVSYEILPDLDVHVRHSRIRRFDNRRSLFAPTSIFGGNAAFPADSLRGLGVLADTDNDFDVTEVYFNKSDVFSNIQMHSTLGVVMQQGRYDHLRIDLTGYKEDGILNADRAGQSADWQDVATNTEQRIEGWDDNLMRVFGGVDMSINKHYFVDANFAFSTSSKLGENANTGFFYGLGLGADIKAISDLPSFDYMNVRASYGVSGNLPFEGGLSKDKYRIRTTNGVTDSLLVQEANPDMSSEKKREINLGLDLKKSGYYLHVDIYQKDLFDVIYQEPSNFPGSFGNQFQLSTRGVDLNLGFDIINNTHSQLTTWVNVAYIASTFKNTWETPLAVLGPSALEQDPLVVVAEDFKYGTLLAPDFAFSVNETGFPEFNDVNGDGLVNVAFSNFELGGDFLDVGSGAPTYELGWVIDYRYKDWSIFSVWRGAFGHQLYNRTRLFHENISNDPIVNNVIESELAFNGIRFPVYSSLFIEDASFIRWDNLSISKKINLKNMWLNDMHITLTATNLLTISNYSGLNPEPSLDGRFANFFGLDEINGADRNPLVTGIDSRRSFLPTRSVALTLNLNF